MVPEARPAARLLLAIALLAGGVASALGEGGAAPSLSPSITEPDGTEAFGAAAYYYFALSLDERPAEPPIHGAASEKASSADPKTEARRLYRRAYEGSKGLLRREAGNALLQSLDDAGLWSELLSFSSVFESDLGSCRDLDRRRLRAASSLGLYPDAAAISARIALAYPEESAERDDELSYYAALAALRSPPAGGSEKAWRPVFRKLILEAQFSDWSARAFALLDLEPRLGASFSEAELHAAAMRDAVWRREYGIACREARSASGAALSATVSTAMAADAGKAFLYAGASKDGETLFAALEADLAKKSGALSDGRGLAWTVHFYRARFARALESWKPSSDLFAQAAARAPTKADADSCLWYAADSIYRGALARAAGTKGQAPVLAAPRAALLDALVAASASWNDPAKFADLVDDLLGDALRARDFGLIESMAVRLEGKLDSETSFRLAYIAARIFELGIGAKPEADRRLRAAKAAIRFAAVADSVSAPLYYRALSAWRAGIKPGLVALDNEAASEAAERKADIPRGELEEFLDGMAEFGLVDAAFAEAKAREDKLDDAALRRLALRFSSSGRPDCALRLALLLSSREGYRPLGGDYELLYPRPYLDLIRSRLAEPGFPEALALGLIRSESVFRADAKSRVGAVGLTQLMPATAAAQAKSLGIRSYDLEAPKDNLDIGLAHFYSLLRRTEGRPLRAMMAYNAGWGRYRSQTAGTAGLPDDLVVESFDIDETRQYCRKILSATVMYDALYYGKGLAETVGSLVKSE